MITEKDIIEASKSYFIAIVPKVLLKVAQSYVPFLLIYPFNLMLEKLFIFLCTKAADLGDMALYFVHVDFSVSVEGNAFLQAKAKLRLAFEKNDPVKIKEAQNEVKITMEKFVKFNN